MIKDLLKEGFILKSKGYYKHAIEAFYKALEIDNTSPELLLEIADTYYLMGEEEHAINYLELILDKNPTHIGSLKLLEKIFINKKAYSEAEQTAKNIYCISANPKDLANILSLLNKQKRYSEVFEYKTGGIIPDILYEIAYAKLFSGCELEAEELINKAIEDDSKSKYFILKGKTLFKQNRQEECNELLDSIPFDNDDADLLNFAGLVKQHKKDYKTALKYFLEALKINPSSAEYHYNCASTYFKADEITLAKKYYNTAISLEPENPNYHFALANLYYSQKQYKRALEELNLDLFEARLLKAIILYDTGYLAIAKKELGQLSKFENDNIIIKEYLNKIETELSN